MIYETKKQNTRVMESTASITRGLILPRKMFSIHWFMSIVNAWKNVKRNGLGKDQSHHVVLMRSGPLHSHIKMLHISQESSCRIHNQRTQMHFPSLGSIWRFNIYYFKGPMLIKRIPLCNHTDFWTTWNACFLLHVASHPWYIGSKHAAKYIYCSI